MSAASKFSKIGRPEFGLMFPPHRDTVGSYNNTSEDTLFFRTAGS
jgi:hypothetical protein